MKHGKRSYRGLWIRRALLLSLTLLLAGVLTACGTASNNALFEGEDAEALGAPAATQGVVVRYSASLAEDSPILRDLERFYHARTFSVNQAGLYLIEHSSPQSFANYLMLYQGTFNPEHQGAGLVDASYELGGRYNPDFYVGLEAGTSYTLVTTTGIPGDTGSFTNTVTFVADFLKGYESTTQDSPTWEIFLPDGSDAHVPYHVQEFRVSRNGDYYIIPNPSLSPILLLLYTGEFTGQPYEGAPVFFRPSSSQSYRLLAGTSYFLVTTNYTGDFTNSFYGPKNAVVTFAGDESTGSTKTPAEAIAELQEHISSLGLHRGTENSLLAKLRAAESSLAKGQLRPATNQLNAFINEVNAQRGKKIAMGQASYLIEAAEGAIRLINN